MKYSSAFTLIEVMVVVAIIGIISAVAWPTFERYERKVTRTDAIRGLSIAANDLEKCAATQGGDYTGCGFTSAELAGNQTPNGKYNLVAALAGTAFEIDAIRVGGNDLECQTGGANYSMVINNLGQQGIRNGVAAALYDNSKPVRDCWNR